MTGSPTRLLAWFVVLSSLLAGCTAAPGAETQPTPSSTMTLPAAGQIDQPLPTPSALPAGESTPAPPPPTQPAPAPPPLPGPFALNLYQEGDFVPQYTFDWCVAASIQMAHNLMDDTGGAQWAGRAQQNELWDMARARSSNSFNGANPLGWAQVQTEVGLGPYEVVSIPDYQDALRTAARAITETGRPVGLVMWSGRHAWVMSGFESVGDPALFTDFSVTGIHVLDPLYPHGSGQWGPSPAPNSLLTPEQLSTQFVVREPRRWSSGLQAGYLLVLPRQA
ncbi:hypothetical protein [Paenarthrobacter sp. NCHU4564]|uniref:hypothetical protein n=1 Tax=Paenarthrobacter sp. NCHU4564 TaxID=3451353 RepID=UPI003F9435C3